MSTQYIERRIVGVLVADLLGAGYSIDVNSRDDTELAKSTDRDAILKMIFDGGIDEGDWTLDLYKDGEVSPSSWVLLVLGNGSTVISDYTVNLDAPMVMLRADALHEKIDGNEEAWMAEELAVHDELIAMLTLARECIAYCRRAHKDVQSGDGIPVEVLIDATLEKVKL